MLKVLSFKERKRPMISFKNSVRRTKQEFAAECDINNIVKRCIKLGHIPPPNSKALFGEFDKVPTFEQAAQVVAKAHQQFDALPADIRDHFANDPRRFLKYMEDLKPEHKAEEMVRLGMASKKPVKVDPPPMRVEVINPTPADKPGGSKP